MNIVYATSDLYSKPALISLKTVLDNNRHVDDIQIYYIECNVSEENKVLFVNLANEYGRNIHFIPMPEQLDKIGGFVRNHPIVYSYCYLQDILPQEVKKVLLLEADAIVVDSLVEMYKTDLGENYFGAVDDMIDRGIKKRLGIRQNSPYVNCGIILFNLKKMREDDFTSQITPIITEGKVRRFFEVQDEMNVLAESKVKVLPLRCNVCSHVFFFDYDNLIRYRHPSTKYSRTEYEDAAQHPIIVHFTKIKLAQTRPWIKGCSHPYREYYLNAKNHTALADMALWEDQRNTISKLAEMAYKKGAKKFVVTLLGIFRSFVISFSYLYRYM